MTLNRPDRGNALVPEMMAELAKHLRTTHAERAVVLTGAGSRFCLGADLKWAGAEPDPGQAMADLVTAHHQAVRAMRQVSVPVIAAVNGSAAGGGMSLALAADYRLASRSATFTAAYFRLGLTPDGGNSAFLARTIGVARAMDLLVTNRTIGAEEALAWGLVGEVPPHGELLDRARSITAGLPAIPPETLLATRRLLDEASSRSLEAQLDEEEAAMKAAASRPEFGRALREFLERRR